MILLPSSIDRPISPDASLSNPFSICTCALWISPNSSGPSIVTVHSIAASLKSAIFMKRSWLRVFYSPSPQSFCRFQVIYLADSKDAATVKEFADFLEAHGGEREAVTDASIDMGAAFEAGIKANFENAEITFDKFHVIKLANQAVDEVRRQEAKTNFQIKGRRYIFLKNVDHLTLEEKEALSRLEAQNLDTIQAMQIRMNLQQLFTMDAKTARRFLDRWNAWVQICDLGPMKRLAKTIMAKAAGILRSIATGLSNGVLEAINGNVQAAKRKAKGYRTKRNLKAIVYLIAGDVLANSPT